MSIDKTFIENVFKVIEEHEALLPSLPPYTMEWYSDIKTYCLMELRVYFNQLPPDCNDYLNTFPGEMVSDMIWQYNFDEDFNNPIQHTLVDLANQRDMVIQNPLN